MNNSPNRQLTSIGTPFSSRIPHVEYVEYVDVLSGGWRKACQVLAGAHGSLGRENWGLVLECGLDGEGDEASLSSLCGSSGVVFRDPYGLIRWRKLGPLKNGAQDRSPSTHV